MATFKFSKFDIARMVHTWCDWKYDDCDRRTDSKDNQYMHMETYRRHIYPRNPPNILNASFKHFNHCRQMLRAGIRGVLVNRTIPLRRVQKRAAAIKGLLKSQLSNDNIICIMSFL